MLVKSFFGAHRSASTDLTLDTLMRMTSLLSVLPRTARLAIRAVRLELEDGRDRTDLVGHVGQQRLGGRRCSSDGTS